MKNRKSSRMSKIYASTGIFGVFTFFIGLVLFPAFAWIYNLVALIKVVNAPDLADRIAHLVTHAIGLIPYCSMITMWF